MSLAEQARAAVAKAVLRPQLSKLTMRAPPRARARIIACRDGLVVVCGKKHQQVLKLDTQIDAARAAGDVGKPARAVAKRINERMVKTAKAAQPTAGELAKLSVDAETLRLKIEQA